MLPVRQGCPDRHTLFSGYALFLFSPRYTREPPERVSEWIERATAAPTQPPNREIALQRIDLIYRRRHGEKRRLDIQNPPHRPFLQEGPILG